MCRRRGIGNRAARNVPAATSAPTDAQGPAGQAFLPKGVPQSRHDGDTPGTKEVPLGNLVIAAMPENSGL